MDQVAAWKTEKKCQFLFEFNVWDYVRYPYFLLLNFLFFVVHSGFFLLLLLLLLLFLGFTLDFIGNIFSWLDLPQPKWRTLKIINPPASIEIGFYFMHFYIVFCSPQIFLISWFKICFFFGRHQASAIV